MKTLLFASVTLILMSVSANAQWLKQRVNTSSGFRGLSVVDKNVVWASGTGGTVIRTVDAGKSWSVIQVPDAERLDFRDIEAFDRDTAYVLSIGNGDSSRIYKTTDGGKTWQLKFRNTNEKAFFDAIACWDKNNCIAMSDPVDGRYLLIETSDGETWKPLVPKQMPAAKDGEAAFAASGTCLIAQGRSTVYLVSGGTDARVFRSTDRGQTWTASQAPLIKGTAGSGIFSIAMLNTKKGVIVGGNYEKPNETASNFAFTNDGGASWISHAGLNGYRSGVTYAGESMIIAVGTSGTDVSYDGGTTWKNVGSEDLNAVQAKGRSVIWAVGPRGMIARWK